MKRTLSILCVSLLSALALTGCGSSQPSSNSGSNATASSNPSPAASGNTIGVAACDEYLTKMEKCLSSKNIPDATKEAYRNSFEQYRDAWKKAAADPNGKAALEAGCKAALEGAKAFFDTCK